MIPNPQQYKMTRLRRVLRLPTHHPIYGSGWAPARATTSPAHILSREAADDLNHNVFASFPRPISMRRILAGLEVVRPRCAAGAPPRPRLRSTAPYTDRNEANKHETTKDPIFTGVPNTDKESVSGVNGVSTGAARGRNDFVDRQVGPHRVSDLADLIGLVGQSVR